MDFAEALRWLDERINLESSVAPAAELPRTPPRLDRMVQLVGFLADPQQAYPVLHLTGTNGKTSTARILTRLLEVAGLSVGTYTSPHLESITERIAWNSEPMDQNAMAAALSAVASVVPFMDEPPTYFEALTAAAFRWFAEVAVHAAVVEVGILGRWDATNVAEAQVAVVTNVGADHLDYAGSREAVAREKAGIVKPGSILVLGETDPELVDIFAATPAEGVWLRGRDFAVVENLLAHQGRSIGIRTPGASYEDLYLGLRGAFQADNAAIALAAAEAFLGVPLEEGLVKEAFLTVGSPGRLEVMSHQPLCVLDGAHNAPAAAALGSALVEEFVEPRRWTVVMGVLRPHDPKELLGALDLEGARVIACRPSSPRAVPAADIAAAAAGLGLESEAAGSPAEAVSRALALSTAEDAVLVTGSLYAVGEARRALQQGLG
ncbi:MAG: bifunctional folylpolyglutamate synthase/dihydrofolate synthase [Actinobacteria bacterium]|nr:bifunctional folylpolyglutamate synthase/dihydrofolate synthase [Actinomycetota bacterium]MBW3649253.1 bifunctional folylpolyglutamate synthase/dihydrofolate synthase [Actinomycetota bacterium]